jgi:hypothetical protein
MRMALRATSRGEKFTAVEDSVWGTFPVLLILIDSAHRSIL